MKTFGGIIGEWRDRLLGRRSKHDRQMAKRGRELKDAVQRHRESESKERPRIPENPIQAFERANRQRKLNKARRGHRRAQERSRGLKYRIRTLERYRDRKVQGRMVQKA